MNSNTAHPETYEYWARYTLEKWMDKMHKLKIGSSGQLAKSLLYHVITNAGGDVTRIEFFFDFYGKFVDMGVGKYAKIGEVKELRTSRREKGRTFGNRRRPKPWFSKTFYAERMALINILQRKYAIRANLAIINGIEG